MTNYTYKIVPAEERITLDRASKYEICNVVTDRISMIEKTFQTFLKSEDLLLDINQVEKTKLANIDANQIINYGDKSFIKLSSTRDIARCEVNKKLSPHKVLRIMRIDDNEMVIYAELVSINELLFDPLSYHNNISI